MIQIIQMQSKHDIATVALKPQLSASSRSPYQNDRFLQQKYDAFQSTVPLNKTFSEKADYGYVGPKTTTSHDLTKFLAGSEDQAADHANYSEISSLLMH
jgi:hypothetical protein